MQIEKFTTGVLITSTLFSSTALSARDDWTVWLPETAAVPFIFSTETLGTTIGVAGLIKGVGQPNAGLVVSGLVSDKGSSITYLNYSNFQVGDFWLLGFDAYNGKYAGYDYFLGDGGDNDSAFESKIKTDGEEDRYNFSMRYIVPWGAAAYKGASAAMNPNRTVRGASPATSGITAINFEPFFHRRVLDTPESNHVPDSTWGMKFGFDWDNRNDVRNPSLGARFKLDITHSPSTSDGTQWTTVEIEQSHFFDLGEWKDVFKRQVLALDMYIADTPTWNDCETGQCQRPPEYAGITLGGLYRLRGYSAERFHGRSAIHYSAEYRVMPEWQPLGSLPVFNWYNVPWWQWVAFIDAGRVADEYNFKTLHTDMKWNAGAGVRFQIEGIVVRTEMAFGGEEGLFRVMVNQPF